MPPSFLIPRKCITSVVKRGCLKLFEHSCWLSAPGEPLQSRGLDLGSPKLTGRLANKNPKRREPPDLDKCSHHAMVSWGCGSHHRLFRSSCGDYGKPVVYLPCWWLSLRLSYCITLQRLILVSGEKQYVIYTALAGKTNASRPSCQATMIAVGSARFSYGVVATAKGGGGAILVGFLLGSQNSSVPCHRSTQLRNLLNSDADQICTPYYVCSASAIRLPRVTPDLPSGSICGVVLTNPKHDGP